MSGALYTDTWQCIGKGLEDILNEYINCKKDPEYESHQDVSPLVITSPSSATTSLIDANIARVGSTNTIFSSDEDASESSHAGVVIEYELNSAQKVDEHTLTHEVPPVTYTTMFLESLKAKAKSIVYDTKLTSKKVKILEDLRAELHNCFNKNLSFNKIPPRVLASVAENEIRNGELKRIADEINVEISAVANFESRLTEARGDGPQKQAEAKLRIVLEVLRWLNSEDINRILHVVLGYEAHKKNIANANNYPDPIMRKVEELEICYISDLFKWMYSSQLEQINGKESGLSKNLFDFCKRSIMNIYVQSHNTPSKEQRVFILFTNMNCLENLCRKNNILVESGIASTLMSYVSGETMLQKFARSVSEYCDIISDINNKLAVEASSNTVKELKEAIDKQPRALPALKPDLV